MSVPENTRGGEVGREGGKIEKKGGGKKGERGVGQGRTKDKRE